MTQMEKTVHQKAHDLACMDRAVRKGATAKGIRLWSKHGVSAGADSDIFFMLVECFMYSSIVELYNIIKEKHWA